MISHPTTIITSRYISSSTKTFAPTFLEIWKLYLLFKLCRSFARYISRKIVTWSGNNLLWVSKVLKYPKKVFGGFDNERNWVLTMAFWATCKIAQPIQPIWQHIFALPWSALKKPPWEFNFFHIFGIPSSSRHEKCCQMMERLFVLFHHSRNIPWGV